MHGRGHFSSGRRRVSMFSALGSFEQRRGLGEKTSSFHLCVCTDLRGFGARADENSAGAEMEAAIGRWRLTGSNVNIRRCLEDVTCTGDWEQIRGGTDGNEAEEGSSSRERRERTG